MIWVDYASDGDVEQALVRSDAVLRVIRYVGGVWMLFLVGRLIPQVIRDFLYDVAARHRSRASLARPLCPIPSQGVGTRFLD